MKQWSSVIEQYEEYKWWGTQLSNESSVIEQVWRVQMVRHSIKQRKQCDRTGMKSTNGEALDEATKLCDKRCKN